MDIFNSVRQVGIAVDNLEDTIKIYTEKFGCTNWIRYKVDSKDFDKYPHFTRGEQRIVSLIVAKTHIGELEFEFIQSIEGDSIYREYLDTQPRKNGVQHISFNTNDFSAAAEFLGKQYDIMLEAETPSGFKVMIFDSLDELGYATEIQYVLPKE